MAALAAASPERWQIQGVSDPHALKMEKEKAQTSISDGGDWLWKLKAGPRAASPAWEDNMENQSWAARVWPESSQVVHVPQADEARRGLNSQEHKGSWQLSRALVPHSLAPCSGLLPLLTSRVNCRLG